MRGLPAALALSVALASARARALEPGSVAGEPVLLEVNESSSVYYNFDNRDSKPNQVATRANDDFGLVYNRLSLQATRGHFSALRLATGHTGRVWRSRCSRRWP